VNQQATQQLTAIQFAQPPRLSLQLFCACDAFPGKPMQQAKVIER
jgi:hypothetical protein